jgi:hypothetical protein
VLTSQKHHVEIDTLWRSLSILFGHSSRCGTAVLAARSWQMPSAGCVASGFWP